MDCALSEFSFVKTFFHAEDTTIFTDIFKETTKYVITGIDRYHQFQNQTMEWVNGSFDFAGVIVVAMMIQSMITVYAYLNYHNSNYRMKSILS